MTAVIAYGSDEKGVAKDLIKAPWPTFVISLDKTSARAQQAAAQLLFEQIPFEFFKAVDGALLHRKRIQDVFDRARNKSHYKYPLSEPEIGCYLSHITLWNRIAHSDHGGAFIFEDDFQAEKGFGKLLRSISALPLEADVISLHQSRWRVHRDHEVLRDGYRVVEPFIAPPRTTGYAITKQAAALLYKSALPFSRPVDIDLKHWWESGIRYLTVYPSPLRDPAQTDSTISACRSEQRRQSTGFQRFTRNLRYQSRFHCGLVAAHLKRRKGPLWKKRQAAKPVESVKLFKGHSGCAVALCRRGNDYFIRKSAGSAEYNERLFNQMQKQASARRMVRTPRVLDHGYLGNLFYFDMDYVQGSDCFTQLEVKTLDGINETVDRLLDVLENFIGHQDQEICPEIFTKKIESVRQGIQRHPFYSECRVSIDRAIGHLVHADWSGIPQTECHGDLTLENMLFAADGSITLIDFLDGDMASGWLDLAKLLYDFESGWSLRGRLDKQDLSPEDRLVALLSRYLQEEIRLRVQTKFANIWQRLPQLQLMQAIRVLPYVGEKQTFARVTSFIDGVRIHA